MRDSVDSNVLIYLALRDPAKASRAARILFGGVTISVQVLNEVTNVLRRKSRFDWDEVARFLVLVRRFADILPLTDAIHRDGLRLARRYKFAVYDAMIVAAALDAGCAILWSEDMQDGLVVDGRLTIRNPFGEGVGLA